MEDFSAKFRLIPQLWMAVVRVAIVVVFAIAFSGLVIQAFGPGQDARQWSKGAVAAILLPLSFLWLVFMVPAWVRYPVFLCDRIELQGREIAMRSARGRMLINGRYDKVEALPRRGEPTEPWFTMEGCRHRSFDLPLNLLSRDDRRRLLAYVQEFRQYVPPAEDG